MSSSNKLGGEQPLEDRELCCLVETLPTRCLTSQAWLKACEYATVYATTVTLLPTHQPKTNAVMLRNRRIGVGIIDFTGWKHEIGMNQVIKWMRKGYEKVTQINRWLSDASGTPESIRKTTMKPGGTTPKLAGRTAGAGHPNFIWTLRRVRVAINSPIVPLLKEANLPFEPDVNDPTGTLVFEWPIKQGPAKESIKVSLWEQAMNLVTIQREWSDNAVSNTLNFKPKWELIAIDPKQDELSPYTYSAKNMLYYVDNINYKVENNKLYKYNPAHEEDDIEAVLSDIAPVTKSVSLLPQTADGVYPQMPESGITEEEYNRRKNNILPIDWSQLKEAEAEPEKYCQGDICENIITIR